MFRDRFSSSPSFSTRSFADIDDILATMSSSASRFSARNAEVFCCSGGDASVVSA